jgi:glycosyltransferase involved in cell wall biosynthesis
MAQMAVGLARSGIEFRYLTAAVLSSSGLFWTFSKQVLPSKLILRASSRVKDIPASRIINSGILLDIAVSLASEEFRLFLMRLRNFWCSVLCIYYILILKPKLLVVQAHSNALPSIVAKKLNITIMLNVSIAHHDWMVNELTHEKETNPLWSKNLQHQKISRYDRWHLNREIANSDFILASSSFTISTFQEQGVPPEKFLLLPLGYDPIKFDSSNQSSQRNGFIYVGQLTQRKGLSYLIDAYERFASNSKMGLQLIGRDSGGLMPYLTDLPGITIQSHVDQLALSEYMHKASVFVLPSLAEGFCLSALEAMASGLVVILYDRTGVHDIVRNGENGFIIDPRDTQKLAGLMEMLNSKPQLISEISKRAKETAAIYTWDKYQLNVLEILKRFT